MVCERLGLGLLVHFTMKTYFQNSFLVVGLGMVWERFVNGL